MKEFNDHLTRRTLLTTAAAAAATGATLARAEHHENHEGHGDSHGVPKNAALSTAALDCVRTGEDCMEHCLESFRAGDTSLAECASLVRELTTSCGALHALAAAGSSSLKLFARAAREICATCEKECRKHHHHAPCMACAESCAACIEQCDAFAA